MPEFPKLFHVGIRHPRPKFLHDVKLWYWNDLGIVLIAVKRDSDVANRLLRLGQMPRLQVPFGGIWPAKRIRGVGDIVIHEPTDVVAGIEPIQELIDFSGRNEAFRLGLHEHSSKRNHISSAIAQATNGWRLRGNVSLSMSLRPDPCQSYLAFFDDLVSRCEIGSVTERRPDRLRIPLILGR